MSRSLFLIINLEITANTGLSVLWGFFSNPSENYQQIKEETNSSGKRVEELMVGPCVLPIQLFKRRDLILEK